MKKGFKHVLRRVILQGTLKRIERINQTMEMKSIVGIIAIRIWREGIDVSNTSNAGLTGINEKKKVFETDSKIWGLIGRVRTPLSEEREKNKRKKSVIREQTNIVWFWLFLKSWPTRYRLFYVE